MRVDRVLAAMLLVVALAACTGPGTLATLRDRAVVLPPDHQYLTEQHLGSRSCLFGDCPQLVTYYTAHREPDEACSELEQALAESDVTGLEREDFGACVFTAWVDDVRLTARVTDPREELPPTDGGADPVAIDRDHRALKTLTLAATPRG